MGYSYSGFSRGNYVNSRSNTSRGGRSSQAVSNYNYTNQNRTYSNNNIQTSDSKKGVIMWEENLIMVITAMIMFLHQDLQTREPLPPEAPII